MAQDQATGFSDTANATETERKRRDDLPECPVCLQVCIHPVELPCNHIFCFLCIKGVANRSKRCALCRHEIPVDYLNNPVLLKAEDLKKDIKVDHGGYQWFYEGRNGWWQYDERTTIELEEKFSDGEKIFELLIAGFLYVIDIDNMIQVRRNDPFRRRRIKRDLSNIERKGVAGLKIIPPEEREGAYGEEGGKSPPATGRSATGVQGQSSQGHNSQKSPAKTPNATRVSQAPRNTPHTASGSEASTPELDRDLSLQMDHLNLDTSSLVSLDSTRSTDLERSTDIERSADHEGSFRESLADGSKSD